MLRRARRFESSSPSLTTHWTHHRLTITTRSYNAKLTSTKAALASTQASGAKLGKASPLLGATFSMMVPAGVDVSSFSSWPKLATTPSFNTTSRLLTWALGTTVQPGKSVKLSIKMVPRACTTPEALLLNGRFTFTDATGPQTARACLEKPVRCDGMETNETEGQRRVVVHPASMILTDGPTTHTHAPQLYVFGKGCAPIPKPTPPSKATRPTTPKAK